MTASGKRSPFISTEISGVPLNQRGLVHVWGQNSMTTTQNMGIHWVVKNPSGVVVEDYQDWSSAGAGGTHEFIGGRFDLNKAGTWTIVIGLFMNSANPVSVASYSGTLCVVSAEAFAGKITKMELEYDSARGAIPVQ